MMKLQDMLVITKGCSSLTFTYCSGREICWMGYSSYWGPFIIIFSFFPSSFFLFSPFSSSFPFFLPFFLFSSSFSLFFLFFYFSSSSLSLLFSSFLFFCLLLLFFSPFSLHVLCLFSYFLFFFSPFFLFPLLFVPFCLPFVFFFSFLFLFLFFLLFTLVTLLFSGMTMPLFHFTFFQSEILCTGNQKWNLASLMATAAFCWHKQDWDFTHRPLIAFLFDQPLSEEHIRTLSAKPKSVWNTQ